MRFVIRIIDFFLDIIFFNVLTRLYFSFKVRFIYRRIHKVKGQNMVNKIRQKGLDFRIHGDIEINDFRKLVVGNHVRIGKGGYLSCEGGLVIGDNVQISRNVLIFTNNHNINSTTIPYDNTFVDKKVVIGNSVWIGMNVTIAPGTIIGNGAIIGMGAVISGIIPEGAIVVGAKHRIIGNRNMKKFNKKSLDKKFFGLLFPDS